MHGILKLHVFVWRIRLRILLQPDDQVGGGFRVYWEVTAFRLLITVPGAVDEVAHELFRSFLVLRKAPDRGTIGDMGHCGYSHAVPSEQWRLEPFFFLFVWVFFFPRREAIYSVLGAGKPLGQRGAETQAR